MGLGSLEDSHYVTEFSPVCARRPPSFVEELSMNLGFLVTIIR